MRSLIRTTALAALLATAAGMALAHNCPNEMKAIDAKLATNPGLSADNAAKVKQLRADGETHHKAGKHDDSMKALAEAKKILGI
jgi:demethoxyubiquinone hydroxylase (CLK1/Coq7/Cat5 family)